MSNSANSARLIRVVLAALVGLIFLSAALGKAHDAMQFVAVLGYLLPAQWAGPWGIPAVAALIIAWEVFIGVSLLTSHYTPRLMAATFLTLVVFVYFLVILARDADAPDCGCLGLARLISDQGSRADVGIVRNFGLLWIVGWLGVQAKRRRIAQEA